MLIGRAACRARTCTVSRCCCGPCILATLASVELHMLGTCGRPATSGSSACVGCTCACAQHLTRHQLVCAQGHHAMCWQGNQSTASSCASYWRTPVEPGLLTFDQVLAAASAGTRRASAWLVRPKAIGSRKKSKRMNLHSTPHNWHGFFCPLLLTVASPATACMHAHRGVPPAAVTKGCVMWWHQSTRHAPLAATNTAVCCCCAVHRWVDTL